MDHNDVRKGITNARLNEKGWNIFFFEIAFISLGVGLGTKSWFWGGGLFIGLLISLSIKPLAVLLMLLLSIGWGVAGYSIGTAFDSSVAMIVLGILGFLIGAGIHFSALEWAEDIGT